MNSANQKVSIQERSKKYRVDLEKLDSDERKWRSEFETCLSTFLSSNEKKIIIYETWNAKVGARRIMNVLMNFEINNEDENVLNNYLSEENQMFLDWGNYLDAVESSEVIPQLKNLFVCEFPESVTIEEKEKYWLSRTVDRLQLSLLKKVIFITSKNGLLDEHLENIEKRAILKINEFENKITSSDYNDVIEALMESVRLGRVIDVEELLKNGVDVNTRKYHYTPLHAAASAGHKDVVLMLLKNGAKILDVPYSGTPLHRAAEHGHCEVVLVLLENGVDVNVIKGTNHATALHSAAANGHNDIVKILLAYDANVNAQDRDGHTALHKAVLQNNAKVITTLLNRGADVNTKNNSFENTPLHIAAKCGYLGTVKALVEGGASVNDKNSDGKTAFELAKERKHIGIVEYLSSI